MTISLYFSCGNRASLVLFSTRSESLAAVSSKKESAKITLTLVSGACIKLYHFLLPAAAAGTVGRHDSVLLPSMTIIRQEITMQTSRDHVMTDGMKRVEAKNRIAFILQMKGKKEAGEKLNYCSELVSSVVFPHENWGGFTIGITCHACITIFGIGTQNTGEWWLCESETEDR